MEGRRGWRERESGGKEGDVVKECTHTHTRTHARTHTHTHTHTPASQVPLTLLTLTENFFPQLEHCSTSLSLSHLLWLCRDCITCSVWCSLPSSCRAASNCWTCRWRPEFCCTTDPLCSSSFTNLQGFAQ